MFDNRIDRRIIKDFKKLARKGGTREANKNMPSHHLTIEILEHLTAFLLAVLVWATDEMPGAVFVFDALVTVLVWSTGELPRADSLVSAGDFADTLHAIGTGGGAVCCCVEEECISVLRAVGWRPLTAAKSK